MIVEQTVVSIRVLPDTIALTVWNLDSIPVCKTPVSMLAYLIKYLAYCSKSATTSISCMMLLHFCPILVFFVIL